MPPHIRSNRTAAAFLLIAAALAGLFALVRGHSWLPGNLLSIGKSATVEQGSRWGRDYFPNVSLVTHKGRRVRFFDDLIEGKVVMINFIYTSCPDSCPLETARIAEVAKILGDRVGKDVHIYSISIDPENDTPQVLAQYARRYRAGPGWLFLTGEEQDIVGLRKKLGLYIAEIQQPDSNDHNLSLIIGNQKTGRWMKRSPFENPHVLATQVGSWLHDWKLPSRRDTDFAEAPTLRGLSDGERLFRTRCSSCHTIGGKVVGGSVATQNADVGPDLLGVTTRREPSWLRRWLAEPDTMLEEKDPIAVALFEQYDRVAMPNMRLTRTDIDAVLDYLKAELRLSQPSPVFARQALKVKNAWIREPHPEAKIHAGYLALDNQGSRPLSLVGVDSPQYAKVEIHTMRPVAGQMKMRRLLRLKLEPGAQDALLPGGKHLMMIGPRQPILRGQEVTLNMHFRDESQWSISIPFLVRTDAPAAAATPPPPF